MSTTASRTARPLVRIPKPPARETELPRPGHVTVERAFELVQGPDARTIRKLVTTFTLGELGELNDMIASRNRSALEIKASLLAALRSRFSLVDEEGKSSYQTLDEFLRHIGRKRVRAFDMDLDARFNWLKLRVRSDGRRVTVRSSAFGRQEARGRALRMMGETVLMLGLVAPTSTATPKAPRSSEVPHRYDAFISHASEDKGLVARPLRDELKRRGYNVWLDRFKIKVGDSFREAIDQGLRKSRYGIVILSPRFFKKHWTRAELDALFSKEMVGSRRVILPVLYGMTPAQLAAQSPMLASRLAAKMSDSLATVVAELVAAMGAPIKKRQRTRSA